MTATVFPTLRRGGVACSGAHTQPDEVLEPLVTHYKAWAVNRPGGFQWGVKL